MTPFVSKQPNPYGIVRNNKNSFPSPCVSIQFIVNGCFCQTDVRWTMTPLSPSASVCVTDRCGTRWTGRNKKTSLLCVNRLECKYDVSECSSFCFILSRLCFFLNDTVNLYHTNVIIHKLYTQYREITLDAAVVVSYHQNPAAVRPLPPKMQTIIKHPYSFCWG